MIEENPEVFDDEKHPSAEFNAIAAFLMREKIKGENSFFYPYL